MIPFSLLVAHFLGDFVMQTDWMAVNKSKRWDALFGHVCVYSLFFIPWGWKFVLLTFVTHFVTDAVTSRVTSKLWFFKPTGIFYNINKRYEMWIPSGGNRHWFFVVIGLDQLIHQGTLLWTLKLLSTGN